MKLIICYDDEPFVGKVEELIKQLYSNRLFETVMCDAEQLIKDINGSEFDGDIVLLDLHYRDTKYDGIQIGMMINRIMPSCKIMYFVDDYDAIPKVYDVDHYCLCRKKEVSIWLEYFLTRLLREHSDIIQNDSMEIISKRRRIYISQMNVEYIERKQRVLEIHTLNKVYRIYSSIKEFGESLNPMFVRCHGSFIVNMRYINRLDGNEILMRSSAVIPVGRTYKKEIDNQYKSFVNTFCDEPPFGG